MKKKILLSTILTCSLTIINAQPGKLDPSFGTNGIVKTELGAPYEYFSGNACFKIFAADDGGLFAAIETSGETLISKRHADGSIDSSYGNNGFSEAASLTAHDAVMQPDG